MYKNTTTHGHRFKENALENALKLLDNEIAKNSAEGKKMPINSVNRYRKLAINGGINVAQRLINGYLNSIRMERNERTKSRPNNNNNRPFKGSSN